MNTVLFLKDTPVTGRQVPRGGGFDNSLYKKIFPSVKFYILSNNGREEDAEDIFQDALVIVFRKLKEKQFTLTSSLGTFLFAISKNLWRQQLRRRSRFTRFGENVDIPGEHPETEEMNALTEELVKIYDHHFSQLKPASKNVLSMYLDKASMEEITMTMGYKCPSYAKVKKYLCKEELKKSIQQDPLYHQTIEKFAS